VNTAQGLATLKRMDWGLGFHTSDSIQPKRSQALPGSYKIVEFDALVAVTS
jgi:hypothetical protein